MKKHIIFSISFALAFIMLQILSGLLLTLFYTPSSSLVGMSALTTEVDFGSASIFSPLIIALLALATAFGTTKLFNKKVMQ